MTKHQFVGAALVLLYFAGPCFAGFAVSVTGKGILVSPPASVLPGADSNSKYIVFNEQSGVLTSSLTLDESGTDHGGHDGLATFTPVTLAAGTHFGTTLIQLDPEQSGTVNSGSATIHFSAPILGIALKSATLSATDIFGHSGTTYPTGDATRGLPASHDDKFTLAANGLNLEVNFDASNFGFIEIRIFTASSVPEPASLAVWLGATGLGSAYAIRRRNKRPIFA